MKYITRFFALIGFLTLILVGGAIGVAVLLHDKVDPEPNSIILTLDFNSPIVEQSDPSPWNLTLSGEPTALFDILRAIDAATDDPHVKGIVARFGGEQPSLVQAQEIRAALDRFHKSNKFTYAYGSDYGEFGTGNRSYFLASAFDTLWLQPVGTVSLTGVAIQDFFGKTALDKIGVSADFMQREEYKDFMERGQRDNFSPLVKTEMQALVENLADQIASGIADSRHMDRAAVKDLMNKGPYTGEEAKQAGLITRLGYMDEFEEDLEKKAGKDAKQIDVNTYLDYADSDQDKTKDAKTVLPTKIALITAEGMISDKSSGGEIPGQATVGADELAGAFDDAAKDKDVKAILFRIDSPGGSPAASETIRRAVVHAQKKGKPVIVSMGDTAASGGYWIAMNGDRIIANPSTLTGSIGVVSGKFVGEGLLQKIGVSVDGVRTAENAGMWQPTASFSVAQRARVNALLDDTYHTFVSNVSAARKIPMEKMPDIAKGRVWSGDQAVHIGLVDELGGYDVALRAIRTTLKLADKDVLSLENFPEPPSPAQRFLKLMHKFGGQSAQLSTSASVLKQLQTIVQPLWDSATWAQHPVVARMMMGKIHD